MYIAIDPGENVGLATFTDDGVDIQKKVLRLPAFRQTLTLLTAAENKVFHFIVEDFNLRQDKALDQTGSNMPAARAIGAIEMMVDILGASRASLTMVHPRVLGSALRAAGYARYANNRRIHPPDDVAAYAHGVYHLIEIGLRRHPVLDA